MKSTSLKTTRKETHLTVVNNTISKKNTLNDSIKRIYINTLIPGFSFTNQNNEIVFPKKCILL